MRLVCCQAGSTGAARQSWTPWCDWTSTSANSCQAFSASTWTSEGLSPPVRPRARSHRATKKQWRVLPCVLSEPRTPACCFNLWAWKTIISHNALWWCLGTYESSVSECISKKKANFYLWEAWFCWCEEHFLNRDNYENFNKKKANWELYIYSQPEKCIWKKCCNFINVPGTIEAFFDIIYCSNSSQNVLGWVLCPGSSVFVFWRSQGGLARVCESQLRTWKSKAICIEGDLLLMSEGLCM